jgi:hypothetical protein
MADDNEFEIPQEGDYVVFDMGPLGIYTGIGVIGSGHIGTLYTQDDAYQFIADRMKREQYWPGVWFQDDHGGMTSVDLTVVEACGV